MVTSRIISVATFAGLICVWGAGAEALQRTLLLPLIAPVCISSPFGPRVLPNQPKAGSYHYGVDLPAPEGAAVLATASGTVIRIQQNGPGGLEMLVQHDGFVGVYSHFGMIMPAFLAGKRNVAAGEKLGVVGNTGVTSGAHLYFGMIMSGRPVDPAQYLGVRLCSGEASRTTAADPDHNGIVIGGRRYYQLFLPPRQYDQWQPP
jgi:murein DD-endopeptidase MepM/ murein hydrolase activator NlpD